MATKPTALKNGVDQTSGRSLKAHRDGLKQGRPISGTGVLLKHESERTGGQSPVIVLGNVHYEDLCSIGVKFLAYKWIAPAVLTTTGPRAGPDCEGRSCAGGSCPDPCVCDPLTLRCVKINL